MIITVRQNGDRELVGRLWRAVLCNRESFGLAARGERIMIVVFDGRQEPKSVMVFHGKECVAEACVCIDDLLPGLPPKVRAEIFPPAENP